VAESFHVFQFEACFLAPRAHRVPETVLTDIR
jgi:hypothetical protein